MTLSVLAFLSFGTLMGTFIPIALDMLYDEEPLKEVIWVFLVSLCTSAWILIAGLTTSYSIKDYNISDSDGTGAVYRVIDGRYYFGLSHHPELDNVKISSVNRGVEYHSYVSVIEETAWILPGVKLVDKTYQVNLYLAN